MRRLGEFELIELFTRALPLRGAGVVLGVGDDAAILAPPRGERLVATADAVFEGVHFDRRFTAADVGWKALAVNLSDLAAMGARPLWALVALALPRATDPARVAGIARGLGACARRHGVAVVGGNVTRARELSLTVTVIGSAPAPLRRDGARVGDAILVSGTVGDAALGVRRGAPAALARRQRRPAPRLALGRALRGIASAAIDVSDGLVQDLGHVCAASGVGASLRLEELPLSAPYRRATRGDADPWAAALSGGEDYELCVTVPPRRLRAALRAAARTATPLAVVGTVVPGAGVQVVDCSGRLRPPAPGHDHLAPRRPAVLTNRRAPIGSTQP
ncbi:MAG TPA: thiamine-phosphate kinase [Anaeromyxobacteraceae bacterium]|nr:thiamine-phosphate kinase [Anaeromyxobacteraceae bacterium]